MRSALRLVLWMLGIDALSWKFTSKDLELMCKRSYVQKDPTIKLSRILLNEIGSS